MAQDHIELPDLSDEQFARFAELISRRAHIHIRENKKLLLSNRLRKRLRVLQLENYDDYYRLLTSPEGKSEMVHFLEVITTNETYFWRTAQNFEMLKEDILPALLRHSGGETLRFWSAGCSSGEEPYNLAMELSSAMVRTGYFDYRIQATDLSQRMIEFARQGVYSGRKIEKIPSQALRRYFLESKESSGSYEVRSDIKERIDFKVGSLFEGTEAPAHCIFCRNVMIYFSRETQEELALKFYRTLKPGGFLVIGHSESLHMMNTPFMARNFPRGIAYYKPRKNEFGDSSEEHDGER